MKSLRNLNHTHRLRLIAIAGVAVLIAGCARQNRMINGTTSGVSGTGTGSQDVSAQQPAANASNITLPSDSGSTAGTNQGANGGQPSGNDSNSDSNSGSAEASNPGSVPSFGPDALASEAPESPKGQFISLTGQKINLAKLRGQVVLIDFWAPWCPPCRLGMPFTQRLSTTFSGKGLTVLAATSELNTGQSLINIKKFIQGNKYTMTVAFDLKAKFADEMKITGLPTVFILDRSGKVIGREVGLHPQAETIENLKKAGLDMGSFAPKDDPLDSQGGN